MKQENGFTLIEMMIAMLVLLIIVYAAVGALVQASRVAQSVAMQANMQEDLRAGLHFIVRDLTQAGEGIPQGGIMVPYTSGGTPAPIVRPGTGGSDFDSTYVALPAVIPGNGLGQAATGVNPTTGAVISTGAVSTDIITVLYADNTLVDNSSNSYPLNQFAINASPCTGSGGGSINSTGTTVVLSTSCFSMPPNQPTIVRGDLILFTCQAGTALQMVTQVSGQTLTFANGDPAGLNALNSTTYPDGTVAKLVATGDPITMTRIWMVTYYEDSTTNPTRPQLVRQVNYPNYPTAATATYPAQPIGEAIEDLQFTYDIINSTAPAGTYPNGPGDASTPSLAYDSPLQIRAVNVFLAGRSEYAYQTTTSAQFLHNNLSTQVSIRNLSFVDNFNTSQTATQVTAPGP
jgi:prepilin-type N-terminal cleavage/methylation domain-containing protein